MNKKLLIIIPAVIAMIGFIGWRIHASQNAGPSAHAAILIDLSKSTPQLCESLEKLSLRAFTLPGMGQNSSITTLGTGDKKTANEPIFIAKAEFPTVRKVIEGVQASDKKRQAIIDEIKSDCQQHERTTRSPIFLAIKRGIEQLRANGCTKDSLCYLLIHTDGEETEEKTFVRELSRSKRADKHPPVIIDNQGIQVTFCGLAEVVGEYKNKKGHTRRIAKDRNALRIDRIQEVWLSAFNHPELVTFEPFCNQPLGSTP